MNDITTIKIAKETRRLAKILAAYCRESIIELLHRLVLEEMKRKGLKID